MMSCTFWPLLSSMMALLLHVPANALQCYSCFYDTSLNGTMCNETVKTCPSNVRFCKAYSDKRPDGSRTFTKDCASSEICAPDYCDKYVIEALGRKSCNISCCQENLCNKGTSFPLVDSGQVSRVYWSTGYMYFVVTPLAWFYRGMISS